MAKDAVHLSNLQDDPGETVNMAEQRTELVAELETTAMAWRARIEDRWKQEFCPASQPTHGLTSLSV